MKTVYSNSRLSSFEKCPRQFRYRYVDKLPAAAQGIEAFVGKRVHEVLERLYRYVGPDRVPALAAVLRRFSALWHEKLEAEEVRIVRVGTPLDTYKKLGERCLTNHYRAHYPFDGDETVALEKRVHFSLEAGGGYPMLGIIDRLVRTRGGNLEIHDFKTGKRLPSQRDLDEDRQLALYEMGVRAQHRDAGEIRLVWHFLQHGQIRSSTRSPEQLSTLRDETMALIDRIGTESEFQARPSPLCGWCEYTAHCPEGSARLGLKRATNSASQTQVGPPRRC